jgi:hypothetical protein
MKCRLKWINVSEVLYTTLSRKYQFTYLHCKETKSVISNAISSTSVPLSFSLSLVSVSLTSCIYKHIESGNFSESIYVRQE